MTSSDLTVLPSPTEVELLARKWAKFDTGNPVLNHAMKRVELQTFWSASAMKVSNATAQVLAHGLTGEDWHELWQIQQATLQRLLTLQNDWVGGWTKWLQYAGQVSGANSLLKLAERESNISAQFTQLLGQQVADLTGLQENLLVDYDFWLQQKLEEIKQSAPSATVSR